MHASKLLPDSSSTRTRRAKTERRKPRDCDLHMVAKYALLRAAEDAGDRGDPWDWPTVWRYIDRLPLSRVPS